jgi:hypothetical protein
MRRSFSNVFVLSGLALSFSGCDKLRAALADLADGEMCLDSLLDLVGSSRDQLSKYGADIFLSDAISAQEDLLGSSIVVDCQAQDSLGALTDASVGSSSPEGSTGEQPPREPETIEVGSSSQVGDALLDAVQSASSRGMEVAILLDTTGSMRDDQASVVLAIDEIIGEVRDAKGWIAMASFGDRNCPDDDPWYGLNNEGLIALEDSSDLMSVQSRLLDGIVQTHGCDWPESLYDGIWDTADGLNWNSKNRRIIAITDATPLEGDKTVHSAEEVGEKLDSLGIALDTILVGISY